MTQSAADEFFAAAHAGITLGDVARLVEAPLPIESVRVTGASDDSRSVVPGDLYLAFPGSRSHGLDFEREAYERGAVAVLSDRPSSVLPTVLVADPRRSAGAVCALIHRFPSNDMDVYGVTGTNGKTSTALLLAAGLESTGDTVGTMTGIGLAGPSTWRPTARTTPEAAVVQRTLGDFRNEGATAAAVEVSSHAVSEHRVDGVRFRSVGFTNLGPDHLDYHGTMDDYFAAKAELFVARRTAAAAVGMDDPYGRRLAALVAVPCWTWSALDHRADVFGDNIECTGVGTSMTVRTPSGSIAVRLPLLGPHQASNALAALAVALSAGKDLDVVASGFERVRSIPGRLEKIDGGQPFLALVDYMHNTAGQRRLLPFVRTLVPGRVIVVVGATGERDPGKRFPLGATAASLADVVIVSDESPLSEDAEAIRNAVAEGARSAYSATVVVEPDRRRALTRAVTIAEPDDVVVVAGRGCDTEQAYGTDIIEFDDRTVLRDVLNELYGNPA
ncbi:Mur ligase family protein [Rhodococcus sp. NPDC078407]|uniref:Mur ligase family protein n=1 Tax=Rhodococcus sp. NPDC078407 TaxID=3364509 RepID=UPI0037CB1BE6